MFAAVSPKLIYNIKIFPFEISSMMSVTEVKQSIIRFTQYTDQYISSFAMGLLLGYLVRKINYDQLSKPTQFVLWIVCPTLSITALFWGEFTFQFSQMFSNNQFFVMLCYCLGKIMWNIGIGWTMFACGSKNNGKLN